MGFSFQLLLQLLPSDLSFSSMKLQEKAWIERKEREQQKESGATGKSVGIERVIVSGGKSLPPPRQNAQTGSSSDIQAWSPNIAMTTPFYCPRFMKEIESILNEQQQWESELQHLLRVNGGVTLPQVTRDRCPLICRPQEF